MKSKMRMRKSSLAKVALGGIFLGLIFFLNLVGLVSREQTSNQRTPLLTSSAGTTNLKDSDSPTSPTSPEQELASTLQGLTAIKPNIPGENTNKQQLQSSPHKILRRSFRYGEKEGDTQEEGEEDSEAFIANLLAKATADQEKKKESFMQKANIARKKKQAVITAATTTTAEIKKPSVEVMDSQVLKEKEEKEKSQKEKEQKEKKEKEKKEKEQKEKELKEQKEKEEKLRKEAEEAAAKAQEASSSLSTGSDEASFESDNSNFDEKSFDNLAEATNDKAF